MNGTAGVIVVASPGDIDQVADGVHWPGIDRRQGDAHQNIVEGITPDAHVAALTVGFHAVITGAVDQVPVHIRLIRHRRAKLGAGAKAVEIIVEGVVTDDIAAPIGRIVEADAARFQLAASFDCIPGPIKIRVIEFILLDDIPPRVILEADAEIIDCEGTPIHQVVGSVADINRFGILSLPIVAESQAS